MLDCGELIFALHINFEREKTYAEYISGKKIEEDERANSISRRYSLLAALAVLAGIAMIILGIALKLAAPVTAFFELLGMSLVVGTLSFRYLHKKLLADKTAYGLGERWGMQGWLRHMMGALIVIGVLLILSGQVLPLLIPGTGVAQWLTSSPLFTIAGGGFIVVPAFSLLFYTTAAPTVNSSYQPDDRSFLASFRQTLAAQGKQVGWKAWVGLALGLIGPAVYLTLAHFLPGLHHAIAIAVPRMGMSLSTLDIGLSAITMAATAILFLGHVVGQQGEKQCENDYLLLDDSGLQSHGFDSTAGPLITPEHNFQQPAPKTGFAAFVSGLCGNIADAEPQRPARSRQTLTLQH